MKDGVVDTEKGREKRGLNGDRIAEQAGSIHMIAIVDMRVCTDRGLICVIFSKQPSKE